MKTCHPPRSKFINLSLSNIPSYNSSHHSYVALVSVSFSYPHLVVSVVSVEEKVKNFPGLYVRMSSSNRAARTGPAGQAMARPLLTIIVKYCDAIFSLLNS